MKILQFTYVLNGGAGQEVLSMHDALVKLGHESYIVYAGKYVVDSQNNQFTLAGVSNWMGKILRAICKFLFSFIKIDNTYAPYNLFERYMCYNAKKILDQISFDPDIIFIKWVSGFVNARFIADLKKFSKAKIVISFIDQAPLTGGCHYPIDCLQFMNECINCPMSKSKLFKKCIHENYKYKKRYLPNELLIMIASSGDEKLLKKSKLYTNQKILKVLPTINSNEFKPEDKISAKEAFDIDAKKKVILCGSSNLKESRKGMSYLIEAIKLMKYKDFVLLIIGNQELENIDCDVRYAGYLSKAKLIKAYQAADVFVCPSIADSGPMMVSQSIMTGTPVVAFPIGVSNDLVHRLLTGYRAKFCDIEDLANGVDFILSLSDEQYKKMSRNCRRLAKKKYDINNSELSLSNLIKMIITA